MALGTGLSRSMQLEIGAKLKENSNLDEIIITGKVPDVYYESDGNIADLVVINDFNLPSIFETGGIARVNKSGYVFIDIISKSNTRMMNIRDEVQKTIEDNANNFTFSIIEIPEPESNTFEAGATSIQIGTIKVSINLYKR